MLTIGAIVPHSPLLAPRVGKDKRSALNATLRAYQELEERLYALSVETIVMISPHAPSYPDAFNMNVAETYTGTLKIFGDHETRVDVSSDMLVMNRIQDRLRSGGAMPFTITTSQELDYGYTIPLLMFEEHLKHVRLIPMAPSLLDAQAHVDFGRALKDILHENAKRIAVIASADLSHKLGEHAPGGANVEGPAFDAAIRGKLKTMDTNGLLAMDAEAVERAGQCGYRPIMMLMGLFDAMNVSVRELNYEAPFGVGYLTATIEPE